MNIEEYKKQLKAMTEEEIAEMIQDIRRNKTTSMSATRIKAVKEKTKRTNVKSAVSSLSSKEKAELKELLLSMQEEEKE